MAEKLDPKETVTIVDEIGLYIAGALWIGAFVTLFYQVIVWLESAIWPHITPLFLLKCCPKVFRDSWLVEPHGWYGLHRVAVVILDLPLALFLILLGLVLLLLAIRVSEAWHEHVRRGAIRQDNDADR